VSFDCRPLRRQNAVNTRVAQDAIRSNAIVAQDSIEFRTQAFNCTPALVVEKVSAKLHRDAIQRLKRVL